MLAVKKVTFFINGRALLSEVSFELERGKKAALMGRSGAGKTTLLKILAGVYKPHGGEATVKARAVSYIPQNLALIDGISALENVLLGTLDPLGIHLGIWKRGLKERALRALETVGLEDKAFDKVGNLSGGERQRVAIARALAHGAEAILADEPVSNLDLETARSVLKVLTGVDATVLAVMHDVDLAREFFDAGFLLEGGTAKRLW